MSEQDGTQVTALHRPFNDDKEEWKAYWRAQGQPWRTEPEIDLERQKYLEEQRAITPDIEQGVYPFKDVKLSRADVEWLLATHENGRGPIDWSDERQRERIGLDVRGADLCQVDLGNLPLACLQGGLAGHVWSYAIEGLDDKAIVHMEKAILREAHLEGANLRKAQMQGVDLFRAHLEGANLIRAHLEGANLRKAQMQGVDLFRAHLEAAYLNEANLAGADLRSIFFDTTSTLRGVVPCDIEHGFISVADARWASVNLALLKWPKRKWGKLLTLGDEAKARQVDSRDRTKRLEEYEGAVRANRQLTSVLRDQGLNELGDHFAYRAQLLQRVVWRLQRRPLKFVLSWFLYLLAGYGYRPARSVTWYFIVIFGFALAYFAFRHIPPLEALVFSLTSFHGRGFFPGNNISLRDPIVMLAAFEAVVGLLIEISFIATFTQRFFGK